MRDAVAMYGRAPNQLDGDTSKALEYANGLLEGLKDRVKQSEDSLAGRSSRVAQGAGIDLAKHESQFGYEFDAEGNITNVGEAAANIRYMQELINQKN